MPRKKANPAAGPPQTIRFDDAKKAKMLAENAAALAGFAATALNAAETIGIKTKPLEDFTLSPAQRAVLLAVADMPKSIKAKLKKEQASITVADVASMTLALAEASTDGETHMQMAMLLVAKHLAECLQTGITEMAESRLPKQRSRKSADPNTVYQFKIMLIGSKPPIWRRIQVADCTLDKLHEHIQTAMGWTNSHLHQFDVGGKRYGDPELLDDGLDSRCVDSTRTKLSKIVPTTGKQFRFIYEYDFGDGWMHEILFEGCPKKEPGKKYPLCLEGRRCCPPEDVGGIGGFYNFLEALADPTHEEHEDFLEWGGDFDPDEFDVDQATKDMRQGLPNWWE